VKERGMASEPTKRLFYKIGEVCALTDTQPYVLRFWESEFPQLAPNKSRTGQRIYRPRDIELVREIKKLLYEEGYTIAGARKKLGMDSEAEPAPGARLEVLPSADRLALLEQQEDLRSNLAEILGLMDATDRRIEKP
jgi:DNA-binding transcriptional MerR regulator